jgi:hypothetical protein
MQTSLDSIHRCLTIGGLNIGSITGMVDPGTINLFHINKYKEIGIVGKKMDIGKIIRIGEFMDPKRSRDPTPI